MGLVRRWGLTAVAFAVLVACEAAPTGDTAATSVRVQAGEQIVAACLAAQCDSLGLSAADLTDYSVLNDMPHVTALDLTYSRFADLGAIAGMSQLTELQIAYSGVSDLSGLAAFTGLTRLRAQQLAGPVDHSPIAALRGLEVLGIGDDSFDQVSVVAGLPRLRSLFVELALGADLTPLRGHPSLEVVDFGSSRVTDLSVLTTLPRLREVRIVDPGPGSNVAEVAATLTARGVTVDLRDGVEVCGAGC